MSKIHVGNLVTISHWIVPDDSEQDEGEWVVQSRFQNANTEGPIDLNGRDYDFLPFLYQGATRTRTGDNLEAALVVSTNQISMDYAYDIVMIDFNNKQHHIKRRVTVRTCLLDNDFKKVQKVLTLENWIGASMNYDAETVEITLASAIDAVFAGLPNQYLDENNVGRLPTTARVTTT
ncbi:hypothetical protein [uncultured phage MedDCM-OCT-S09-C28]|nr:hypothetical protein [uncultured phage MedDCM-OCT-S09-C28]